MQTLKNLFEALARQIAKFSKPAQKAFVLFPTSCGGFVRINEIGAFYYPNLTALTYNQPSAAYFLQAGDISPKSKNIEVELQKETSPVFRFENGVQKELKNFSISLQLTTLNQ